MMRKSKNNLKNAGIERMGLTTAKRLLIYGATVLIFAVSCKKSTVTSKDEKQKEEEKTATVVGITAGLYTSFAIKNDNSVWACGSNGTGELGTTKVLGILSWTKTIENVRAVSSMANQTMIIKTDNTLWACGQGYSLINGTDLVKITENVKDVAAGGYHTLVVKPDNSLWTFGSNTAGQLGDGTATARASLLKITDNVKAVSAGANHTLVLKNDNTLWACGNNSSGELGDGTTTSRSSLIKVADNVKSAAAGYKHSLIVKNDNTVWSCGSNGGQQLGDPTINFLSFRSTFAKIGDNAKCIATGGYSSLVIKNDDTLWGCGGWVTNSNTFSLVKLFDNVQAVSSGGYHTLIIKKDKSVWAFGNDANGAFGNGIINGSFNSLRIF